MAASSMLVVLFVIGLVFWPLEIWIGLLILMLGMCAFALGSVFTAVVGFLLGGLLVALGIRRAWRCAADRRTMIEALGVRALR